MLALRDAMKALARDHHANYDPSHDFHHVRRVVNLSILLARSLQAEGQQVDLLTVELAAWAHDLLDS